jgi:quercetin dioxygenase-like cupin family protein
MTVEAHCVSGRLRIRMDDGDEIEVGPGDAVNVPPGHVVDLAAVAADDRLHAPRPSLLHWAGLIGLVE